MSLIKANTIKPVTSGADLSLQGDSGGSAVDCLNITSAGDVDFSGNTDAKIKLPSAGGIYKGASDTAILTESGGAVTLDNVALGSSAVFPAGHVLQKVIIAQDYGNDVPNIGGNATVMTDTGIAGSFVTKMSSANSMLFFHLSSGGSYLESGAARPGTTALALTTASNTTYAEANDTLGDQTNKGEAQAAITAWVWMYKVGTRVPSGLTAYTAGQTLYARIFYHCIATYSWHLVNDDNEYQLTVEEVKI